VVVHTALPDSLTAAVDAVLEPTALDHAPHGDGDPVGAAERAAGDPDAVALIGPFRSADVAEAVEATAPRRLPLLAPVATWAGVTRADEPGCDDEHARHDGTIFRLVARDTVVAQRIAAKVGAAGQQAHVIAGAHGYGRQLDGQLRLAGLPRAADHDAADVIVLCGLAGEPEIEQARALAPLPIIAFDGIQGADLGPDRDVQIALVYAPTDEALGTPEAQRAAALVVEGVNAGHDDLLATIRALGPFDDHGDPIDPPVYFRAYEA
jgi:hypothetical protein